MDCGAVRSCCGAAMNEYVHDVRGRVLLRLGVEWVDSHWRVVEVVRGWSGKWLLRGYWVE